MKTWKRLTAAAAALVAGGAIITASTASAQTQSTWCANKSDLAIVGTSADTGYGTTGYVSSTDSFARTLYGWTTKFSDLLKAGWNTTTTNYAHNGSMASDYLPGGRWTLTTGAVADMATRQPDLVIIDLGGNEFWAQKTPATLQANLTTLITNIRTARPGVDILLGIYPELKWAPNPDGGSTMIYPWSSYATAIYNTAVAQGTALVDLRQYLPAAPANPMTNPTVWLSDAIHLNEAGNLAELGAYWGWTSSLASIC